MIDMHNHILPGIDDGAPDMEEALAMARSAVAGGVKRIVCTPHAWKGPLDVAPDARDAALAALETSLADANIALALSPGAECSFRPDIIKILQENPRYLMGTAGKTVLLEWPEEEPLYGLEHILFEAQLAGFKVLLAHAERCAEVLAKPSSLKVLVDRGLYVQIQASSLNTAFSWKTKRTVTALLKEGLAHVIATDAHRCNELGPSLNRALDKAKGIIGPKAEAMVTTTPAALLGS